MRRFPGHSKHYEARSNISRALVKKVFEHGANSNQNIFIKEAGPRHNGVYGSTKELCIERKDLALVKPFLQHVVKSNTSTADVWARMEAEEPPIYRLVK